MPSLGLNGIAPSPARRTTTTHACTRHHPTHRTQQDFQPPSGEVKTMIEAQWKSLDNFISTFNAQTAAVQVRVRACEGLGWSGV